MLSLSFSGLTQEFQRQDGGGTYAAWVGRGCRAAGLTGNSSSDPRKPQTGLVHSISFMFAFTARIPTAQIGPTVRRMWRLRLLEVRPKNRDESGREITGPSVPYSNDETFAQAVAARMRLVTPRLQRDNPLMGLAGLGASGLSDSVNKSLEGLTIWVWQGGYEACIADKDLEYRYSAISPEEYKRRDQSTEPTKLISTVTSVSRESLERLGRLVRESELEAARRGVEISTATAWKALGFKKPEDDYALRPLIELPLEETKGSPAKKGATTPARVVAADGDQPTDQQTAPGDKGHSTRACARSASAGPQVGLVQPYGPGEPDDPGPQYEFLCAAE